MTVTLELSVIIMMAYIMVTVIIEKRRKAREEDIVELHPPKRLSMEPASGGTTTAGTASGGTTSSGTTTTGTTTTGTTTTGTTTTGTTTTGTSTTGTTTSGSTGNATGSSSPSARKTPRGRGRGRGSPASGEAGAIGQGSEEGRGSASGEAGPVGVPTPKKGRGRGFGRSRLMVTATYEQKSRASSAGTEDSEARLSPPASSTTTPEIKRAWMQEKKEIPLPLSHAAPFVPSVGLGVVSREDDPLFDASLVAQVLRHLATREEEMNTSTSVVAVVRVFNLISEDANRFQNVLLRNARAKMAGIGRNSQKRVDTILRRNVYGVIKTLAERTTNLASTVAQRQEFDVVDLNSARGAIGDARRGMRGLLGLTVSGALKAWGAPR